MAATYRRKQDAILGLDNSTYHPSSDTLAHAVARYRGDTDGRMNEVDDDDAVSRMESSRDYARSYYEHNSNVDDEYDVSDLEDSDEDEKSSARIPAKANQLLGLDQDSPWRRRTDRTGSSAGISSKAQKLLGISKALKPVHESSPKRKPTVKKSLSPDRESIAPKALRTLGIPSKPYSKSNERQSPQGLPYEPEEFKRLLLASTNGLLDSSSSTDVSSSLSRESTISWRTETPRSSQEVYLEDIRWRSRPSNYTKRLESLVDPKAVLTEPFSPLSMDNPWNKPLPDTPSAFTFELPGDLPPPPRYSMEKSNFVAELPGDIDEVYEMPAEVPQFAELPGTLVESPGEDRLSREGEDSADKSKQSTESLSAERPPLKIDPKLHRTLTAPTGSSIGLSNRQSSQVSPLSPNVAYEVARRPTVAGTKTRQEDTVSWVRGDDAAAMKTRESHSKAKSIDSEVPPSPSVISPSSPLSINSGLALIAAKAAVGRRRTGSSTSTGTRGLARSKFNPDTRADGRDLSASTSSSSIREEAERDREDEDATPKAEVAEKSDEEYPESPVTGYIAGHPSINKPLPQAAKVPNPVAEKISLNPKEMLQQVDQSKETKEVEDTTSITISNLREQGFF